MIFVNSMVTYLIYGLGLIFIWNKCGEKYGFMVLLLYILYQLIKIENKMGG